MNKYRVVYLVQEQSAIIATLESRFPPIVPNQGELISLIAPDGTQVERTVVERRYMLSKTHMTIEVYI